MSNIVNKLQYAVLSMDEGFVDTSFYPTEHEAIQEWERNTGESWDEHGDDYVIQGFTQEEIDNLPTDES